MELAVSLLLSSYFPVGGVPAGLDLAVISELQDITPAVVLHNNETARVSICVPSSLAVAGRDGRAVGVLRNYAGASSRGGILGTRR